MLDTYYILIAGTRTYNDYEELCYVLDSLLYDISGYYNIEIVQGGAKGADTLAKKYANAHQYKRTEKKAKWDLYGKAAGFRRNAEMHDYIKKHDNRICICFWDGESVGTQHNFILSKDNNTQLYVYDTIQKVVQFLTQRYIY